MGGWTVCTRVLPHISSWLVPCALRIGLDHPGNPRPSPHMRGEPPQALSGHAVLLLARAAAEIEFVRLDRAAERLLAGHQQSQGMTHAPGRELADSGRLGQSHRRHSLVGLQDKPQAGQPDPKWQLRRMQRRPRRRRELKPAVTIRALIEAGARLPTDEFNRLRGVVLGVPSRVTRHGVLVDRCLDQGYALSSPQLRAEIESPCSCPRGLATQQHADQPLVVAEVQINGSILINGAVSGL